MVLFFLILITLLSIMLTDGIGGLGSRRHRAGLTGLGPDVMGWVMLARVVIPPAITIVALLPLLGAGSDPEQLQTTRVSNTTVYILFLIGGSILYLRSRKPKHL